MENKITPEGITKIRKSTGMLQAEFARKIGVGRSYLSEMESGKKEISWKTHHEIKNVLANEIDKISAHQKTLVPMKSKELLNRRKLMGLTQMEFSEKLGVGQSFLSEMEKGKRTISWTTHFKVLEISGGLEQEKMPPITENKHFKYCPHCGEKLN